MNASTFTARVDRLHRRRRRRLPRPARSARCPARCTAAPRPACSRMIEEVERTGDAGGYVKGVLDRGERLMGFGHRVYRAEDPRARVLRRTAKRAGRAALRGRRGAGEGRAGRAARPPARPGARDQRRVLGGDRARLRRGAGAHVHLDVHLRPHGRLVRAHPRAEAHRPADPARPPATSARARASRRRSAAGHPTRAEPRRRRPGCATGLARPALTGASRDPGGRATLDGSAGRLGPA